MSAAVGGQHGRLTKLFYAITSGKRQIRSYNDAKNFLEACVSRCQETSPSYCVEVIISSPSGKEAVRQAVRINPNLPFILSSSLPFIRQLWSPDVERLNNGDFLEELLLEMIHPPTFWQAILHEQKSGNFSDDDLHVFAWLCLKVATIRQREEILGPYIKDVEELVNDGAFSRSQKHEVRVIHSRLQKILRPRAGAIIPDADHDSPGGRHDNDFADFREIDIFPTNDELISKEKPFLQRLEDVFRTPPESRAQNYLDWLFRLLREDMLAELREDLQIALEGRNKKRRPIILGDLRYVGYVVGSGRRTVLCALSMECRSGLEFLAKMSEKDRREWIHDKRGFLKHQSLGALCYGATIIAFGMLQRDENLLAQVPPSIVVQFTSTSALKKAMQYLNSAESSNLRFVVVNTATFAYEPILRRLQQARELPLDDQLLGIQKTPGNLAIPDQLGKIIAIFKARLKKDREVKIPREGNPHHPILVDGAQLESLIHGLEDELAQIQGPPGTGKSFIGALIILLILQCTKHRILVLSYTNHAIDQFIEDMMHIGVKPTDIVRLGSKSTEATAETRLENHLKNNEYRLNRQEWTIIDSLNKEVSDIADRLAEVSNAIARSRPTEKEVLNFLELSEAYSCLWDAFQPPPDLEGFQVVGPKNKELTSAHIYNAWLQDADVKTFWGSSPDLTPEAYSVWEMPVEARRTYHEEWSILAREEQISEFAELADNHDALHRRINSIHDESKRRVLSDKRVIACTTTAAAMYQSIINTANPDVIMLEEAGEILEAHVITALGTSTKQLILIGDHKQLRPKINNYALTAEKGDGYDLNVSLFERLIKHGNPFTTLREQHRSHPDISSFARMLAYPQLQDVEATHNRAPIRGLTNRVTFVHHEYPEDDLTGVADKRDPTAKASKRNQHEAEMVLKMVKYLGQQDYKTANMVVLTPYLGQLSLLRDTLRKENDPYLNDLDSNDLVRAGLLSEAAAKVNKKPLRLSTIDNYQGEESDIVIVSLTRSNSQGDIGFLSGQARLVVLMSRARNGIILFGNMHTFMKSKKGKNLWTQYFEYLKEKSWLFDGVPVYCEQHPHRQFLLKAPRDFDQHCPDGGCAEQCQAKLSCGHGCKRRCHRLQDHSRTSCEERVERTCSRGHKEKLRCGRESQGCRECAREDEETRRRVQRDVELERKRQEAQNKYKKELQQMEDEVDHLKRTLRYAQEEEKQQKSLAEKKDELQRLQRVKEEADRAKKQSTQGSGVSEVPKLQIDSVESKANEEWQFLKESEGASNSALDELMGMIGLESVKQEFLSVKTMVDTRVLQGVSLDRERFSCSLLGNPGTGKTTVARLWAKFLTSIGAISGSEFKETTGSKMASDGVKGCEKLLEDIKNEGGGVLLIDEAYQLSSGNSPGGKAVLDYLLAEVENLRGKVAFVLAGYSKQMESFFAHNPGLPSRFPIEMKFDDYNDKELLDIFRLQIHRTYQGRMQIEDGSDGLYARIAVRRVGYSRGKEGFGNARAIENCVARILKRQTSRLRRERRAKKKPDNMMLTKEDIIGPEPTEALKHSKAWEQLQSLIGLEEVKETAKVLVDTIKTNYDRELAEEPLVQLSLNRVFVGSPGTGKTTVAKYYGQVLVDLGLLSNGEVVVKNPADFVGSALGQSEAQTKGILAATVGKVLVIDEAYGLYGGGASSGGGGGIVDPYKTAVVDTIVAEVQSVPGEDRCVLLLGYRDKMEEMFQNVNPGLSRRFPMASAFEFEDFDDDALAKILDLKLSKSGFTATGQGKRVALEVLRRARNRPNFGNAGEIDILLNDAKLRHQKRSSAGQASKRGMFEAVDFDEEFDRAERSDTNIRKLFEGEVGREELIDRLERYQKRVRDCKLLDIDPEIPFNFLFRGPPGTGKTTTAKKIGKVYCDMGFLATAKVEECSATDLIGQYVGQTGPRVQQLVEKTLGRVLFIDEAYRLSEGPFAKEALDELVDLTTKEKYQGKLIIILAGYVDDINQLISRNPGMTSRFPEVVDFKPLDARSCISLLVKSLSKNKTDVEKKGKAFDISCLTSPREPFRKRLESSFKALSTQDGWASARDVKTLAKEIWRSFDLEPSTLTLTEERVNTRIETMYQERESRMRQRQTSQNYGEFSLGMQADPQHGSAPITQTAVSTTQEEAAKEDTPEEEPSDEAPSGSKPESLLATRDAGVSDAVWEQLERDAEEEVRKERELADLKKKQKTASEADRERIVRQILEEEAKKRKEQEMKARLMMMGACPVGYHWIKQQGGYRCAGGSHWMSDGDIESIRS